MPVFYRPRTHKAMSGVQGRRLMLQFHPAALTWAGRVLVAPIVLLTICLLNGCSHPSAVPSAAAATSPQARVVGVVKAAVGEIPRTMTQPATIQGMDEATLYAKTAGYLKAVYVDRGDRVRAGQILALISSPELMQQRQQARAVYLQSQAATQGAVASRRRAEVDALEAGAGVAKAQADSEQARAVIARDRADVLQAGAGVARARADAKQAQAVINHAQADVERTAAQLPKYQALVQEADENVQQAIEAQAQAEADVQRWQQQVKAAQATARAAQSALKKAEADTRLQQVTYDRLKAIQNKDAGLIAAQDVDVAETRLEVSRQEADAARDRADAAEQDVAALQQQVTSAQRGADAAARKVSAAKNHAQAAREDVNVSQHDLMASREQVKIAQAQLTSAQRQVDVASATRHAVSTQVPVAVAQSVSARRQVDIARGQRRSLREQVQVVDAQVHASRLQSLGNRSALAAAGTLQGYTHLVAPFDGVITERLADPGSFVQNATGNQAAARGILKVVRDSSLRVMIPVPENNIPLIRRGGPVVLSVDAYPKRTFPGMVTRFASAVDPKSRTMLTEVDIANGYGLLHPGMYARVTLTLEVHHFAVSVPSEAVMGKEDDRFVYTVSGGKAHKTVVKVGVDDGKRAEITSGLKGGATVVLTGRDTLVNGAAVKTEPAPKDATK